MIVNTIKELPVTLLKIKSEAINDDFITNIKQKMTPKNEKVPEVFSLFDNVLCKIFQIKHITTPQYHPRSNGQAERF